MLERSCIDKADKEVRGRSYKIVMIRLLQKIVTALLPQQCKLDYHLASCELDDIPSMTEEELMEACKRIENDKVP